MKKLFLFICLGITMSCFSQKKLSELLKQENEETIPYISVDALKNIQNNVILLDAREAQEYKTSHLKNAILVGYDFFNVDAITQKIPNKKNQVVVYCSIGIRSEDIAQKLKNEGYTNVFNLYGGIFEWKNRDLEVLNSKEKPTDSVHTFSKVWSKWLKKGVKVYD